jgi:DNA transposition AAA+ family ATPase
LINNLKSKKMIDQRTKEQIKSELNKVVAYIGSANKAAATLGISNATISNIQNGKDDLISADMWRKIAAATGMKIEEGWQHADTTPFKKLCGYFNDAKKSAQCFAIVTNPGAGKSYTLDYARDQVKNVFYVKCLRSTTERDFLTDLLRSMGKVPQTQRLSDMLKLLVKELQKAESPVIIVDEFEKVKTELFLLAIDLYNLLEGVCGLVFIGTPNLKNRIDNGVGGNKLGYNEFLSRVGGKVIETPAATHSDAIQIIAANGIKDMGVIDHIIAESDDVNHNVDLRRVKRLVHAHLMGKGMTA